MTDDSEPFNRGAIRPMQCMREGWQLIKDRYWFFVGLTFVGVLIAGMGPLGVLTGPMMCGLFLCLFQHTNNREVSFNTLFKGFDFFLPSFVATLLMVVPSLILGVGAYLFFVFGMFGALAAFAPRGGGAPDPMMFLVFFALIAAYGFVLTTGIVIIRAFFFFSYPLIVDRQLSGVEAVKLSIRAMWGNLGGVLGVLVLIEVLGLVSSLLCCIGPILELPLNVAMYAVAYRQVFPEDDRLRELERFSDEDDDEPRPVSDAPVSSTEYQDKESGRGA